MKKLTITGFLFFFFLLTGYAQDKPKASYQVGNAVVTVWENEREGEYGEFTAKSFKIEKIYKKDDKWESTNYFDVTELLQLRAAIDKAISEEAIKTENEKE